MTREFVFALVAGFLELFNQDVGFGHRRAGETVSAELGAVGDGVPVVRQLDIEITKLEERLNQLLFGFLRGLDHRLRQRRVALASQMGFDRTNSLESVIAAR